MNVEHATIKQQRIENPKRKYYLSVVEGTFEQHVLRKKLRTATEALIYGRVVMARYRMMLSKTGE